MTMRTLTREDAWLLAKRATELAFIYERQYSDNEMNKEEIHIEKSLLSMIEALEAQEEKWEEVKGVAWELAAVQYLTDAYKYIKDDRVTDDSLLRFNYPVGTQLSETQLKEIIANTLYPLDEIKRQESMSLPLPEVKEVSGIRGPKEYALKMWQKAGGSARTKIYKAEKSLEKDRLTISLSSDSYPKIFRTAFIEAVIQDVIHPRKEDAPVMNFLVDELTKN